MNVRCKTSKGQIDHGANRLEFLLRCGRIVQGANRLGGESTMGQIVQRANRPWGESSSLWAKRPWGETHSGRNVCKPSSYLVTSLRLRVSFSPRSSVGLLLFHAPIRRRASACSTILSTISLVIKH